MKAVLYREFGSSDKLEFGEMPTPQPVDEQIQIQVSYASVNPVDWKIRQGWLTHMFKQWAFPVIPGWDVSGKVTEVGPGVTDYQIGDEVFAYCKVPFIQWGTYCEVVCCFASSAAPKPKSLSMAQAAAVPLVSLTAWQTLYDYANLQEGQSVLIHAGAGGVGSLAIQLAKLRGAKVYTTASAKNHAYVKSLGADVAIDYQNEDFVVRMRDLEPEGLDVIYDCVGGETLRRSYELVKPGGYIPTVADRQDKEQLEELGIQGICLVVRPNGEQLAEIGTMFDDGRLVAPEIHEYPLEKAAKAQDENKAGHTRGKIVLKVGG